MRKGRADVSCLGKRLKRKKGEGNWEEDKNAKTQRGVDNHDNV